MRMWRMPKGFWDCWALRGFLKGLRIVIMGSGRWCVSRWGRCLRRRKGRLGLIGRRLRLGKGSGSVFLLVQTPDHPLFSPPLREATTPKKTPPKKDIQLRTQLQNAGLYWCFNNTFYEIDDSYLNCHHAHLRPNWTTVHLLEPTHPSPATPAAKYQIRSLQELRALFPQFFVDSALNWSFFYL